MTETTWRARSLFGSDGLVFELAARWHDVIAEVAAHYPGSRGLPPGRKIVWAVVERGDHVAYLGLGEPAFKLAARRELGLTDARPLPGTVGNFLFRRWGGGGTGVRHPARVAPDRGAGLGGPIRMGPSPLGNNGRPVGGRHGDPRLLLPAGGVSPARTHDGAGSDPPRTRQARVDPPWAPQAGPVPRPTPPPPGSRDRAMSFTPRRAPQQAIVCDQCGRQFAGYSPGGHPRWWARRAPPDGWGYEPGDGGRHACPECLPELRSRLGAGACPSCRVRGRCAKDDPFACPDCGGSGWRPGAS